MIKIFVFCFNFLFLQKDTSSVSYKEYLGVINGYKQLLVDIREYKLSPQQARERFQEMMLVMKKAHPNARYDSTQVSICFPLMGFDFRAVGGYGKGYIPRGYDLFDQAKKGSHPAHDIFMKDKDQDCRDDRTGDYVPVLSTTDGIVMPPKMVGSLAVSIEEGIIFGFTIPPTVDFGIMPTRGKSM